MIDEWLPAPLRNFLTSLAIGLLIGMERERTPSAKAGLRTFALAALLGTLCTMLAEISGGTWLIAVGLLAVAAGIVSAYVRQPDPNDPGTTTVVALLVCYGLGALIWYDEAQLAAMIAVGVTALLYFKTELRGITTHVTQRDWISMLQFAVLSVVILPVLPDRNFGPYDAWNPYHIWLMVVLISGVSLAGYGALRLVGARHGAPLIGIFGGLVSSTATTMVFARQAHETEKVVPTSTMVILLANLTMLVRVGVLCAVIAPQLAAGFAIVLGGGLACGLVYVVWRWVRLVGDGELPMPEVRNPTELRAALSFGALFAVVLVAAAWLSDLAGPRGLYAVALVSGLTDVDAITLSTLRLNAMDKLAGDPAIIAICLAIVANLVFKSGLVLAAGGRQLAMSVVPGFVTAALGLGTALFLLRSA
ncbi:MAG TPA: MgtC/SapB family protein [Rhodocyclaceae bacterium]|nr:MgtC/SapB family protein [Rhodocyclaceae bacterium]HMZ83255.1 MgtC/SapB family protein [Rhodocyclaceae bacterium]HNA03242.1 MgtC/SapB family protein [Rhodocyclaceae bacterium]HNB78524.1 MgtC/SapB family protein [Rhodocyclaceae bacterium]HNC61183.1 MgtC/SapB family protein [Rhodocyclaceae bacterium]